ncbi:hypothetical protein HK099_006742 [Clydaea vesicula]|uniref:sn-1-specific diacylglycerol lipase n=1 Tax=Clydaea vesicula TaxID=447962 RepID=A0AAD5Y0S8_9FUNG|nr:hypothetical protein HK099_006742 [Clydaea vesicula]
MLGSNQVDNDIGNFNSFSSITNPQIIQLQELDENFIEENSIIGNRPFLLFEPIANLISYFSHTARLSLGAIGLVAHTAIDTASYATSLSLSLYRSFLIGALSSARNVHNSVSRSNETTSREVQLHNGGSQGLFHRVLDHYTNISIATVNHGFSLAELFTLATFHLTSKSVKLSISAATATVHTFDGIFGSTETSRAIASFVQLVRQEMAEEEREEQEKLGMIAKILHPISSTLNSILTMGSISKALTAYACLCHMTVHRTTNFQNRNLIPMYEGVCQDEQTLPKSKFKNKQLTDTDTSQNSLALMENLESNSFSEQNSSTGSKNLIMSMDDDDNESSVLIKWYEEEDDVTTIEIQEVANDPSSSIENILNDPVSIKKVEEVKVYAQKCRSEMEEIDDSNNLIVDAMTNDDKFLVLKSRSSPSTDNHETISTFSRDFSDTGLNWKKKNKTEKSGGIKSFLNGLKKTKNKERNNIEEFNPSENFDFFKNDCSEINVGSSSYYSGKFNSTIEANDSKLPKGLSMIFESTSNVSQTKDGLIKRKSTLKLKPDYNNSNDELMISSYNNLKKRSFLNLNFEKKQIVDENFKLAELAKKPKSHSLNKAKSYPDQSLIKNIDRYIKFSTGAYGRHFLRILGIGKIRELETEGAETILLHKNNTHTSTSSESGFESPRIKPVNSFICLDHEMNCLVLTFRGTLGLSDILVDLMCTYDDLVINNETYKVHAGMLRAAKSIAFSGVFFSIVRDTLIKYPNYGLILNGHSLGAGVASLLALIWSEKLPENTNNFTPHITSSKSKLPPGRPIHCYAYGVPCVASYELSLYSSGLITSVINGDDLVSTISIGLVRDLKAVSLHLLDEKNKGLSEKIIGKTLGFAMLDEKKEEDLEILLEQDEWFWKIMQELRNKSMSSLKLYPPGEVYWCSVANGVAIVEKESNKLEKRVYTKRVQMHKCVDVREMFSEPRFSKRMITDHSPGSYEETISSLLKISK